MKHIIMDMTQIYEKLQEFFAEGRNEEAEDFLIEMMKQAQESGDYNTLIMLLNEMIGFCRETGQYDKSLGYSSQVLQLMEQLGLKDSQAYATTLLNVATACRAAGKFHESYRIYMDVFPLYEKWLSPGDPLYASLYNNMSLLFQEMEEHERAVECQGKAIAILSSIPGKEREIAISNVNMASSLCKISEKEDAREIAGEAALAAETAISELERLGIHDIHTAAAFAAYGDALTLLEEFEQAENYYKQAMDLIEFLVGKIQDYDRVAEKWEYVRKCQKKEPAMGATDTDGSRMSGLAMARGYYEECGKPVLMSRFPEYFDRMAIGLCGEGSDCLGFDDAQSRDHDHGPGFCIWMPEDLYQQIGPEVQALYDSLPGSWHGYERLETVQGKGRTGVSTYEQYFERILGMNHLPETEAEWLYVDEFALRAAVSGEIFHDPQGTFTGMLEKLKAHYPKTVYERRLAQEITLFEQCGRYNYPRSARRGDMAGANLLLTEAAMHAAKAIYLLEKTYAPHTKWLMRGLEELKTRCEEVRILRDILEHLGTDEMSVRQNMERLNCLAAGLGESMKPQLVDEIVKMEWEAFDQVKNEGGRANCQDDWTTFEIMRKSQYLTWTTEMLEQYKLEFSVNMSTGWNPITEKYARMMESTAPEEYEKLKADLPVIGEEKKTIMEGIIGIQVAWMESFAEKYPKVAGNARSIHTSEDSAYNTSYETYLRGELGTYSDEMLLLYGAFVANLAREGKNLAYLTMENTVHMYGYESVEIAEEKMW